MRREANLDLVGGDWDTLYLHFAVHELLCLVAVAEGRVEVTFHVHPAVVYVLGHWATGDQKRESEEVIRRHRDSPDSRFTTTRVNTLPALRPRAHFIHAVRADGISIFTETE